MRRKLKYEIGIKKSISQETLKTRVQNIIEVANMVQHECGPATELEISFKESYPPDREQGGCSCEDASECRCNDPHTDSNQELREAAQPLVEYIRENHTPMTTAIVTGAGVELVNTEMHVPFKDDWN